MNNLEKRVARLEDCVATKQHAKQRGAEMIWFMPLLDGCDDWEDVGEGNRRIRLCHGMWAVAWCGPPMSDEQIKQLKAEYSGLTLSQAAERFNVPEEWLLAYMGRDKKPNLIAASAPKS